MLLLELHEVLFHYVHQVGALRDALDCRLVDLERILFFCGDHILIAYNVSGSNLGERVLINLFHRVAIEELVLKLASPLGVVEYVLDVLALFVLGN